MRRVLPRNGARKGLSQGRIKGPVKHLWWSIFVGVVGTEGSVAGVCQGSGDGDGYVVIIMSEYRNLVQVFS